MHEKQEDFKSLGWKVERKGGKYIINDDESRAYTARDIVVVALDSELRRISVELRERGFIGQWIEGADNRSYFQIQIQNANHQLETQLWSLDVIKQYFPDVFPRDTKFVEQEAIIAHGYVQATTSKRNAQCEITEENGKYKITINYQNWQNNQYNGDVKEVFENLTKAEFDKYVEYYRTPHGPDTRALKQKMMAAFGNNIGTEDTKFLNKYNANTIIQTSGAEHYLSEGPAFSREYGSSISRYFDAFFFSQTGVKPISHIIVAGLPIEKGKLKFRDYFNPTSEDFYQVQAELAKYGFELKSKAVQGNPDDTIKDYEVTISKSGESKTFIVHHLTHWPDFELPNFTDNDIQKLAAVNQEVNEKQEGLVIHCAAGLGRTGTLESALNPDKSLAELRQIRPGLVQTPTQFVYAQELKKRIMDQKPLQALDDIFKQSNSKDPFALPFSDAYKKIKDIKIEQIVDYVLSHPDKARYFFSKKTKGVATLAGRNFRKELAGQPELLKKLINSGNKEIINAIHTTHLLKTRHIEKDTQTQMETLIKQFDQIPKMPTQSDINSVKVQINGIKCEALKNILIEKANGLANCEPLPTPQEMQAFVEKINNALEKYEDIMPNRYKNQILSDLPSVFTRFDIDYNKFPPQGFKPDENPAFNQSFSDSSQRTWELKK